MYRSPPVKQNSPTGTKARVQIRDPSNGSGREKRNCQTTVCTINIDVYDYVGMKSELTLCEASCSIVEGVRRRGAQRSTWMKDILEWTKLNYNDFIRSAMDRRRWRLVGANLKNETAP